ncbi:MAG: LPS export ABC transporter permease LptF [Candidatus Malihini olakiniferum]
MISIRYLAKETFKSQLAILFILLLIFFCQKLVRILGAAVDGELPINLVLSLLGLGVPEMAQLILPLSLFLALLMTFNRMYTESEITVMYACGLGKTVLLKAAFVLAVVTGIIAMINALWVSPLSSRHQAIVMAEVKENPSVAALVEGQFQSALGGNAVLFIGDVKGQAFKHVFLAQLRSSGNARPSVVIADSGRVDVDQNGTKVVTLNKGSRYEGTAMLKDFRITDFSNYQAVIRHQNVSLQNTGVEQMTMNQLWQSDENAARAEFHWRITLVLSVLIMSIIVVPLSAVNPRQGRVLSMLPAMLLYLIFFLLQSSLRSNASKGKVDPMVWIWLTNLAYIGMALLLNVWDSVPLRRLRERMKVQGIA